MRRFETEPLLAVIGYLRASLAAAEPGALVELEVAAPALAAGRYSGEVIEVDGRPMRVRSLRTWVDLADRLGLRLIHVRPVDGGLVRLGWQRLDPTRRWRADSEGDPSERYGSDSEFSRIDKAEDPDLVLDLADALRRIALAPDARVLDLGVNAGDELELLLALLPEHRDSLRLTGVDHSASAIARARERFAAPRHRFITADLADLAAHELGRFDLVLSLNTLHSPGVDSRAVLRAVVQDHCTPHSALVLGVPNCVYVDGEIQYGARMKNYRQHDLSVVLKEVAFYRRYLQQHRRKVFITGKHHLLVTAVPITHRVPPTVSRGAG